MAKYQGREFTSTLQANTAGEIGALISDARKFANAHHMDNFRVLERGKDPDGGYRAIVTAHNWNPISWVKEKIKGKEKKKVPEEGEVPGEMSAEEIEASKFKLLTTGDPSKGYEEAQKLRQQNIELHRQIATAKEAQTQHDLARERIARQQAMWRQYGGEQGPGESEQEYNERVFGSTEAGKEARPPTGRPKTLTDEEVEALPWRQRRRYKRTQEDIARTQAEAGLEIYTQGVPDSITQYYKTLQKEHWTDKETGKEVPEPQTAEERAKSDYHPSQWVYMPVKKKLSMPEQLQIARTLEADKMEMEILRGKYQDWKRERSFSGRAAKTVAGGLGALAGLGQFAMGAATMGVAGMAKSTQGSSRGRERATRMHAPGVPLDLYGVRPILGIGMPPSGSYSSGGLSHLRALTLPGVRRPRAQVRRTVQQVREEY